MILKKRVVYLSLLLSFFSIASISQAYVVKIKNNTGMTLKLVASYHPVAFILMYCSKYEVFIGPYQTKKFRSGGCLLKSIEATTGIGSQYASYIPGAGKRMGGSYVIEKIFPNPGKPGKLKIRRK